MTTGPNEATELFGEPLGAGEVRCPRCGLLVGTTLAELNGGETVMRVDWLQPIHVCVSR